ncbi:hypothetical protein, partial [Burkholderia sp. SIMBA_019]|uniref:hypothetical protein n=1 Tax=Burkholderia sp. SIMBA_019 TaxID=3085765 RepID=UPI003979BF8D
VTRNRIVNGYYGLGLFLIEAPAVDAVPLVVIGSLFCGGLFLFPVRVTDWTTVVITLRHRALSRYGMQLE